MKDFNLTEEVIRQYIDEIDPDDFSNYIEQFSKDFIRQFLDKISWYRTHTYLSDIKENDPKFWNEIIDDVTEYMKRDFNAYNFDPYRFPTFQDFRKHYVGKCFRD